MPTFSESAASYWDILKQTVSDWLEDKAPKLAASLAIYAMLSIAPMLVIATKVVGILNRDNPEKQISDTLLKVMPSPEAAKTVSQMVKAAGQEGAGNLAMFFSIALAAFSATAVFGELQDSMNTVWEVKPKPNQGVMGFIRTRFLSLAMVLGIAFLFMVSTIGTTLISLFGDMIGGDNKAIAFVLATVVSLTLMTLLFAMIFKFLPDAEIGWKDVLIGAVVTAVMFELGKHVLAWYLNGPGTKVFGAVGSLAAFLLWIYYSAQILFFGAEFTQVYAQHFGGRIQPSSHAVKVTDDERAQQGIVSPERLAAKTREQSKRSWPVAPSPKVTIPPTPRVGAKPYVVGGSVGTTLGAAVAASVTAWFLLNNKNHPVRKHAAAVRLNERMAAVENKLGRVNRIKGYLDQMNVRDRIDRVEHEIRRAGHHVRASETGRPEWMVRLADRIGGRWSNL